MLTTTEDTQAYIKINTITCVVDTAAGNQACVLDYTITVEGQQEHNFYPATVDPAGMAGMDLLSMVEAARLQHVL